MKTLTAKTPKESRFPAPGCAGRRLCSTAGKGRTTPLVPLALLDLPNRCRRVACGSFVIALLLMAPLVAASDVDVAASRESLRADYEAMLEEAEKARTEAEAARQEAAAAAQQARELMRKHERAMREEAQQHAEAPAAGAGHEQAEMERAREELSRAHRELREASREVAQAHRELSRSGRTIEITRSVNLGDRAVIGVVLGGQSDKGVKIIGVSPDGPAEQAGLQQGDVLVSINGTNLTANKEARRTVFNVMSAVEDGDQIEVVIDRDGWTGEFTITAEQREPRGWQSVIRIPNVAEIEEIAEMAALHEVPEGLESPHVIVERIEIEDIDEEALAEHVEKLKESLETKKFIFMSDEMDALKEFEFEEFSEFGAHAMSEANIWFGLPRAHGLELTAINEGLGSYFATDRGVLVIRAREDNPYQLESGDVILSVDAAQVDSPADLVRALRDAEPGAQIDIEIKRERQDRTLSVAVPENRLGYR
jgi:C-terminal processing protease CtpA/Prc